MSGERTPEMLPGTGPDRPALWTPPFTLAVLGTAAMFVGFFFLLPTLPPYAAALGASKAEVGLVIAVYTVSAAIARVGAAPRMDRDGPKLHLVVGLVLFVVAVAAYARAQSVGTLLALRAVHGAGWGLATAGFGTLVAQLAPAQRRGEAIGWWGTAPTAAMAVAPIAGGLIVEAAGYAAVFVASSCLAIVALALVAFIRVSVVHDEAPHRRALFRPPPGALMPSTTLFLSSLAYGALTAFLPVELGDVPGMAGSFFAVFGLSILVSRPFAGRLSDRAGRAALIGPGLAIGAVGTALVGFAHEPLALFGAAVLVGVGIGGAAFPVLLALAVDRSAPHARGAAVSTYMTAYDAAIALGAVGFGPLYEAAGFARMNAAAASFIVLALVVFTRATRQPAGRVS